MKNVNFFKKIVVLLSCMIFSIDASYANNSFYEIVSDFWNSYSNQKVVNIKKLAYKDSNWNIRSVLTNDIIYNENSRVFNVNDYAVIEESDIVVVKYKDPALWANYFSRDSFQHAVMAYKDSWFIHAPGWNRWVERWSFNLLFSQTNPNTSKVIEAKIVKVHWITASQRREVSNYASKFLWVKYPLAPNNKYETSTIFCTALVWQSHFYSWKKVDLDGDGWRMVMPSDLFRAPNTTVISVTF